MTRKLTEKKIVLASHNQGKLKEISEMLKPFAIEIVSAKDLGLPEPDETGATFVENALIKAHAAAQAAKMPALADDSGLCVHALDNQPGIYSARWAGPNKDFKSAMNKVNDMLEAKGNLDRSAHFSCVLALAWPDGHAETFEGRIDGNMTWPIRGEHGFGFDPMFVPEGFSETFAEMGAEQKDEMSHRGQAFALFTRGCLEQ